MPTELETTEENKKIAADTANAAKPAADPELEAMFKAGLHFGYSRTRRHPRMEPYLFGTRNNVEVFDLEKTRQKLNSALDFVNALKQNGRVLLLVGAKAQIQDLLEQAGMSTGLPYVSRRWIGGLLTNFSVIRKRIDYYESLRQERESGALAAKYTKKEINDIDKSLLKLQANFGGVLHLKKLPDALFIIDPKEESTALREAKRVKIPVIALASSDVDPVSVDYVIPGNDSARASVKYILDRFIAAWNG